MNLPQYQSFKVVQAMKILSITTQADGSAMLHADMAATPKGTAVLEPVMVTGDWMRRHKPEHGGWFVFYPDGYSSYSPAKAFEEGYVQVGDPVPPAKSVHPFPRF